MTLNQSALARLKGWRLLEGEKGSAVFGQRKTEEDLNERLASMCSEVANRLLAPKYNKDRVKVLRCVDAQIIRLEQCLQRSHVFLDLDLRVYIPHSRLFLHHQLLHLQGMRADITQQIAAERQSRGANPYNPRNAWLDYFILTVADEYSSIGGKPNAQPDHNGEFNTPFMRVLGLIHQHLPKERRAKSISVLGNRARRALAGWGKAYAN
jgi:hypothetical protein